MEKINKLLNVCMEDFSPSEIPDSNTQFETNQPVSDEQFEAVMEELNRYITVADNISHEIAQNEVNIANIVGSPRPEVVMSPDGEFLADVSPDIQPTISSSDNIGVVIPLEIAEQNNKVYQNAAGQLNYVGDDAIDQMREDLEIQYNPVSMESVRMSPLMLYRAHTEGLKETLSKFIEKIKEMIKWIFARLKDVGHNLILLFEKFNGTKDKLIAKFKEGQKKEKKFKDGVTLSSDTLLTMLTDYPDNLDIALNLQFNVLQPYTKQFMDAYSSGNSETLNNIINKAKDELINNRNKEGENFLTKIGVKGTDGFICIVRPGQILKLNVESSIWSVDKEDIKISDDLRKKLMSDAKPDGMWEDALLYLKTLGKVEQISKNYIKLSNQCKSEDTALLTNLNKVEENFINQIKFIYSVLKFKKTILDSVLFTPRAIISACTEIYKSIEIKQPNGDYSVMSLPKPVGESFGMFISQEGFFDFLKKNKKEETKEEQAKMDIISAMVISNFYTPDNFKSIKMFCDNSARKCRELLINSNKDLNSGDDKAFSKWDKAIDKEIENYVKEASKLSKRPIEFLKSIGVSSQYISKLQSYGSIISLTKVLFKGHHDATICAVVVLNDGNMTELRLDDNVLNNGFESLTQSKKDSLIKMCASKMNSIDYTGGKTVWESYRKLYNEFSDGEFGEYDDNLNNKLCWFWDAAEQGVGDFSLDYEYTIDEVKSMVSKAYSEELNKE